MSDGFRVGCACQDLCLPDLAVDQLALQAGEEIEAPDAVWAAREVMDVSRLPASWDSIPAGSASVRAGSNWLSRAKAAILQVPSVIVPEESAAFINPLHP